jgi:hypothetical protein
MAAHRTVVLYGVVQGGEAPDSSRPIAALPTWREVRATRIGRLPSGVLGFVDEIALKVNAGCEKELRLDKPGAPAARTWRAIDVRTSDPRVLEPRLEVLLAGYPYSTNWIDWARFRKATHHPVAKYKEEALSAPEPQAYLRELAFDVFETSDDYALATLDEPRRTASRGISGHRWRTQMVFLTRPRVQPVQGREVMVSRAKVDASWIFGLCEDVTAAADETLERLKDSDVVIGALAGQVPEHAYPSGRLGVLQESVQSVVPDLVRASVLFALAGPPEFEGWEARPVTDLATKIFLLLLYNANRRARDPETPVSVPDAAEGFDDLLAHSDEAVVSSSDVDPERLRDALLDAVESRDPENRRRGWVLLASFRLRPDLRDALPLGKLRRLARDETDSSVASAASRALGLLRDWPHVTQ